MITGLCPIKVESKAMTVLDRRNMLGVMLGGAAIAAIGLALTSKAARAVPAFGDFVPEKEEVAEKAQVVVVGPRRRRGRRRWRCWWSRGRRVCGWRW